MGRGGDLAWAHPSAATHPPSGPARSARWADLHLGIRRGGGAAVISCGRDRDRSLLPICRHAGRQSAWNFSFQCRRPAELICSEIKGGASDRATCNAGIGLFYYLLSTDGTMRASFWRIHSLSRPGLWWVWDLKPPAPLGGPQAPTDPLPPSRGPLTHLRPCPGLDSAQYRQMASDILTT